MPKGKRTRGFLCPDCHRPTEVAVSRAVEPGCVQRVRLCPSCEFAQVTSERPRLTVRKPQPAPPATS